MPLLIELRHEEAGIGYDDIRWHLLTLTQMRELGPRWAILTGPNPVCMAVFSEIEGFEVGMFASKDAALTWLRGPP